MNEKDHPGKVANPLTENSSHSSAPDRLYEVRLAGWLEGYHSRDAEIAKLDWDRDRIYTELVRRPGVSFVDPNRPSYADLERLRGNAEHADQIDAQNAARFSEVTK